MGRRYSNNGGLNVDAVAEARAVEPDAAGYVVDAKSLSASHLQRALREHLAATSNWSQLRRVRELSHKEQSHKWLWLINPRDGSVMSEADYRLNIQKRLGARILEEEVPCRQCGEMLDPQLNHCECCAIGESTKGHYAVVGAMVEGLKLADAGVVTEPPGLTCTSMRPADILTTAALPGRSAALDVTVASPEASHAGVDAAETAVRAKYRKYRHLIPELRRAGIIFRPLAWSADGRPHAAVTRTLAFATDMACRRNGGEGKAGFLKRWKHEIAIALLRRRAAMSRACLPKQRDSELWLLTGSRLFAAPVSNGRKGEGQLPSIEDDEDT